MSVKINRKKTAGKAEEIKKNSSAKKTETENNGETSGKKEKKKSEKKEVRSMAFTDRITFAANLIISQKFTDEEIIVKVNEKFPEYPGAPKQFNQKEMGRTRWMLNNDKLVARKLGENEVCSRLFKSDDGKLVERSALPKKVRSAKKKVNAEDDPLNTVAGINVHDKEESVKSEDTQTKKNNKVDKLAAKIKKTKAKVK